MDQVKIGKFIAALRKDKGLTQDALGQSLGVTNKTVSRWENGNYLPDIEMLGLLRDFFQVSIEELLAGERLPVQNEAAETPARLPSPFTRQEQEAFWKKKWLKAHWPLLAFSLTAWLGLFIWAVLADQWLWAGAASLAGLILYGFFRNRMMIYVEGKLYPPTNR